MSTSSGKPLFVVSKGWTFMMGNFNFLSILCTLLSRNFQETSVENNLKPSSALLLLIYWLKKYLLFFLFSCFVRSFLTLFVVSRCYIDFTFFNRKTLKLILRWASVMAERNAVEILISTQFMVHSSFQKDIASDCHSACAEDSMNS